MTGVRSGVIGVGDEIRLGSNVFTVVTLSGKTVRLIDAVGDRTVVPLPALLADPSLEVLAATRPALCSASMLDGVPDEVAERARWWERHVGLLAPPGVPRAQNLIRRCAHCVSARSPNTLSCKPRAMR
jgi:hypothetical protein